MATLENNISDQSNLTKRPHRRRSWTVHTYLPRGANVPSNTCFLVPTRVHIPNGISIGSAVSICTAHNRDRQTDTDHTLLGR